MWNKLKQGAKSFWSNLNSTEYADRQNKRGENLRKEVKKSDSKGWRAKMWKILSGE